MMLMTVELEVSYRVLAAVRRYPLLKKNLVLILIEP